MSLIYVLPDDEMVEPDSPALRLPPSGYEEVDIIVIACAGEPSNLDELKRSARDAQFLLAPAGTSIADLRELAMEQTPGDIVTLLSGAHLCAPLKREQRAIS